MIIEKIMYVIECVYTDDGVRLSEFNEGHGDCIYGSVEVEVDFDMPTKVEIRDIKVLHLKESIRKERASAQVEVEKMEDEIQKLMCLGVDDE